MPGVTLDTLSGTSSPAYNSIAVTGYLAAEKRVAALGLGWEPRGVDGSDGRLVAGHCHFGRRSTSSRSDMHSAARGENPAIHPQDH